MCVHVFVDVTTVGENINSINLHFASIRGAARSAHQPWIVDFSSWMQGQLCPAFLYCIFQGLVAVPAHTCMAWWGLPWVPTRGRKVHPDSQPPGHTPLSFPTPLPPVVCAGYITDYSTSKFWGSASSPVGGHSVSLVRRTYFAAFMSGTGGLIAEGATSVLPCSAVLCSALLCVVPNLMEKIAWWCVYCAFRSSHVSVSW